jgi:Uma2 family endonuclease
MPLPEPDHRQYTYADYLTWPDDVRYELIDGVAYLMSPAPTLDHQDVVGEVYRQLANALEGQPCRVYVSPVDVRVPRADEDDADIDTVVQPDVLVICDRAKTDRRGVRGGPDFVVEVLSPTLPCAFSTPRPDQSVSAEKVSHAAVRHVLAPPAGLPTHGVVSRV